MKRFVVLTFLFLGWAFYEMSGGSDFRPPAPPATIAQAEHPESRTATTNADDLTARPVIAKLRPRPERQQAQEDTARKNALQAGIESAPAIFSDSRDDPGPDKAVQLAALGPHEIAIDRSGPNSTDMREIDIRQVIGTHVNMRQGPGTTYPVIARMNLGDKVEVLSDPGNGWLRLRDMRDMRIGWISASLIAKQR